MQKYLYFILILFILFVNTSNVVAQKKNVPLNQNTDLSIPVFFETNKGQYDNSINYLLRGSGANLLFSKDKVLYQFEKHVKGKKELSSPDNIHIQNIQLQFLNYNQGVSFNEIDPYSSVSNYFIGNDSRSWASGISNFKTLIYKDLYNSIDLKYYSLKGEIKYDFIVKPGADLSAIQIKYDGITGIRIHRNGKLVLSTRSGNFIEDIPVAYQNINGIKKIVNVFYSLSRSGAVTFKCGEYDKNSPLIIDPSLIYSTYVGGSGDDQLFIGDMVKDNQGNIYTTGRTTSINFSTVPGSFDVSANGNSDGFIFKLNNTGTALIYSTYIGGSADDFSYSLDLDNVTNELYVCGYTHSLNFPVTVGCYQNSTNGVGDAFVLKLNAAGSSLIYCTYIGGPNDDIGHTIKIDATGNAYVAGETKGGFPVTIGAYQTFFAGGTWDGFFLKLDPAGANLLFSSMIGGPVDDRVTAIGIDPANNIYVAGLTNGSYPVLAGSFDLTFNGGSFDTFCSKLNSTGTSLIYSTYLGGSGDDFQWNGLVVNNNGEAFLTGEGSMGYPTTVGSFQPAFAGGIYDVYVTKLNASGSNLVFSTFLGSSSDDGGYNISLDINGNIFVTGFCGQGFPTTACAYDNTYNGGSADAFISELDATGANLLYSTYAGGSGYDRGTAIVADVNGIYIVGETQSANFPTTNGAFDQTFNSGIDDVFALEVSQTNVTAAFTASNFCQGQFVNFLNSTTGATTYSWGFGDNSSSILINPTHSYSSSGSYTVTLFASGACGNDTILQVITIFPLPTASITGNNSVCSGSPVTLTASGGTNYSWNTGATTTAITVSPTTATTYTVTVTDNQGCTANASITISINPLPSAATSNTSVLCNGGSTGTGTVIAAGGTSPYSYIWSPSGGTNATATGLMTGIYTVTVTDANGCTTTQTTFITQPTAITVTVNSTPANCTGSTGTSSANPAGGTPGYTYLWNNSQTTQNISGLASGNYTVVVTDANGCTQSQTVSVSSTNPLTLTAISTPSACSSSTGTATANPANGTVPYVYSWSNGQTTQTVSGLASGSYSVTVTDANGCSQTQTIFVSNSPPPAVNATASPTIILSGSTSQLNASGGVSYSWFPANGLSCITCSNPIASPTQTTSYCVQATDANGCTNIACVIVVIDIPCGADLLSTLLPNAFSPDGNGLNDQLCIPANNCIVDFVLHVYDRWGEQVFESSDIKFCWDGKYKGEKLNTAVFAYYFEANLINGEKYMQKGNISLIR